MRLSDKERARSARGGWKSFEDLKREKRAEEIRQEKAAAQDRRERREATKGNALFDAADEVWKG